MKKNMFVILVGVAALHIAVFSGLFATGGCTNVVMDERGYVPARSESLAPMEATPMAPMTPAVTETPAPAATQKPAAPVETFQPMTGVTSSGGIGSNATAGGTYTVKAGDTLGGIARRLKVKTADLQKANNLSDAQVRRLQIGQKLVVPGKGSVTASAPAATKSQAANNELEALLNNAESTPVAPAVAPATTPAPAAVETPVQAPAATPAATPAPVEVKTEVVSGNSMPFEVEQDGITLDDFAKQHNTTAAALKQLNADLPADGTLKKGTVIFVPAE